MGFDVMKKFMLKSMPNQVGASHQTGGQRDDFEADRSAHQNKCQNHQDGKGHEREYEHKEGYTCPTMRTNTSAIEAGSWYFERQGQHHDYRKHEGQEQDWQGQGQP